MKVTVVTLGCFAAFYPTSWLPLCRFRCCLIVWCCQCSCLVFYKIWKCTLSPVFGSNWSQKWLTFGGDRAHYVCVMRSEHSMYLHSSQLSMIYESLSLSQLQLFIIHHTPPHTPRLPRPYFCDLCVFPGTIPWNTLLLELRNFGCNQSLMTKKWLKWSKYGAECANVKTAILRREYVSTLIFTFYHCGKHKVWGDGCESVCFPQASQSGFQS